MQSLFFLLWQKRCHRNRIIYLNWYQSESGTLVDYFCGDGSWQTEKLIMKKMRSRFPVDMLVCWSKWSSALQVLSIVWRSIQQQVNLHSPRQCWSILLAYTFLFTTEPLPQIPGLWNKQSSIHVYYYMAKLKEQWSWFWGVYPEGSYLCQRPRLKSVSKNLYNFLIPTIQCSGLNLSPCPALLSILTHWHLSYITKPQKKHL